MGTQHNDDDLAFEAATNRRYLDALARRLGRPIAVTVTANEKWVENIPRTGLSYADFGPLVARIGLDVADEDLGTAFYIGARWLRDFDHPVVSWDAPVAKIFYEPDGNSHGLAGHVVVRRTLLERFNEVVKVFDVWERKVAPEKSPFVAKELVIPSAPRTSARRTSRQQVQRTTPTSRSSTSPADSVVGTESPIALDDERIAPGMRHQPVLIGLQC